MRLRRYIAVVVYFAGFFAVVDLHQREVITSEIPSVLFAVFGFAWLFAFILRNRAIHHSEIDHVSDAMRRSDIFDPSSPSYYTQGPGAPTSLDR